MNSMKFLLFFISLKFRCSIYFLKIKFMYKFEYISTPSSKFKSEMCFVKKVFYKNLSVNVQYLIVLWITSENRKRERRSRKTSERIDVGN